MNRRIARGAAWAAALLALAVLCAGLYFHDNKYTAALPGGSGYNVLTGSAERVAFLVDGWEFYPGRLLGPEDFAAGAQPEETVYIGQYPNFSAHLKSPYGAATYRIRLEYDGPAATLALYLQELLCAGRVYIDGVLVGEHGSVAPYEPHVMDGVYLFPASESTEIIVQTVNYTHYYSGLYYPPAVGTASAVYRMTAARFAVYGLLCFASAAIALANLAHWASTRGRVARQMGVLCLAYSLWVSYPFLRALGVGIVRPLYALEDVCANVVLLCAVCIAGELSGAAARRYHRCAAVPAAAGFCVAGALFPLFILPYAPLLTTPYGVLLFAWKLAAGLYLVFLAVRALRTQCALGRPMMAAAGLYGVCAVLSTVSANRFEPICGAWPAEYGGFALVVCFAALMTCRSVHLRTENRRLTENLQQEVEKKTQALERLLAERRELLATLLHDVKNPLSALRNYAELARSGASALDEETAAYLDALADRAGAVEERLDVIHDFSRDERGADWRPLSLNAFLRDFHGRNRPDMELSGASFLLELPEQELVVRASARRLCAALENLCYNALSFLPDDGCVTLSLSREGASAVISVRDNGAGILPEYLPHVFERGFTRRQDGGGEGLGLFIVHAVALEHGGAVSAVSTPGLGSTFTLRLPLLP